MESFEDYVNGKKLDELMAEAGIVKKNENGALEERALVTRDFVEQEVFLKVQIPEQCKVLLQEVARVEDLFLRCYDFPVVFKEVVRMSQTLEKCLSTKPAFNSRFKKFFGEEGIASYFQNSAKSYLERMLNPKKEDLRMGSKVRRIFVPRFELYRSKRNTKTFLNKENNHYAEGFINQYFDERDKVFLVGDIGRVVGLEEYAYVKFDKEGQWSRLWKPDCNYWKEKKNVAEYGAKELEVLPSIGSVEATAFDYVISKIKTRISGAFEAYGCD